MTSRTLLKKFIRIISIPIIVILLITYFIGCVSGNTTNRITFEQLMSDPSRYNGEIVDFDSFLFIGFEVITLCERIEDSGYAAQHKVPKGKLIWIEGGIPQEINQKLYHQQMMGPTESYGKVRAKGKFQFGRNYGHLGGYNYQIALSQIELLDWSPGQ